MESFIPAFCVLEKNIAKKTRRNKGRLEKIKKQDNNTDLSSYFRVDKKKVLCYTKFTKQSISN